ncbi:DUF2889 domain-containing protein [Sphingomonas populi]|uniref:DUF2889 domain-containing protein n=1 Tax=Sphingomonas populi TaxID=2484750 RepID=A0A4Q6Y364_9SPHN|nr:DUF2889 domain-containing protein [Sphingomonas populi]RZF64702.1 DUF2889 domain-containing protein [Sphingomonas populi]
MAVHAWVLQRMRPKTLNYPVNPDYGSGACYRRVTIEATDGQVTAYLTDNFHEMRCVVHHDGETVTAIDGATIRIPTSVCPGAVGHLRTLMGVPIGTPAREFYRGALAASHCTHLLDLAVIALRHCGAPRDTIIYDATVPDETAGETTVELRRNGVQVHRWRVRDGRILSPSVLWDRTLEGGFAVWASDMFDADDFEAATILARTWLIAIGRRYRVADAAGQPASLNPQMFGRCYAYSMPNIKTAVFTGEPEKNVPPF